IGYIIDTSELIKLHESKEAWVNVGVNNLTIDPLTMIMRIGTSNYTFNDNIIVVDNDELVTVDRLTEQDVLMVRGYDNTIWSITVVKGHGTVRLTDTEGFI